MPPALPSFFRLDTRRSLRVLLPLLTVLLAPLAAAGAQAGSVSGVVIESMSGSPLPDAVVRAEGSTATARTNVRGQFTLSGLAGSTVRLTVTRIGHQPSAQLVNVGATDVRI